MFSQRTIVENKIVWSVSKTALPVLLQVLFLLVIPIVIVRLTGNIVRKQLVNNALVLANLELLHHSLSLLNLLLLLDFLLHLQLLFFLHSLFFLMDHKHVLAVQYCV